MTPCLHVWGIQSACLNGWIRIQQTSAIPFTWETLVRLARRTVCSVSSMHMAACASSSSWTRNRCAKGRPAFRHRDSSPRPGFTRWTTRQWQKFKMVPGVQVHRKHLKLDPEPPALPPTTPPLHINPRERKKKQAFILGASACSFRWNLCPVLLTWCSII